MKTILKSITTITLTCLAITGALAQTQPPQPPTPPSNNVSVHSDETKSSTSYSYSIKDDDNKGSSGNVSISTSSNDGSYSFRLRYDGSKDDQIKKLLYKEMGTNNLDTSGSKDVWITKSGGEEVYEIKFGKGKLNMDVDKEIASEAIANKIAEIGKTVRTIITGQKEGDREAERLQREADRLQRDADRMRREADRLQQQEQRNIDRIKREADRLAREAERAGDNARRSGGVSAVVIELLKEDKTYYDGLDNGTAWVLPKLLPLLMSQLEKDGFIKTGEDINILNEESGMYINGNRISKMTLQYGKYNAIFKKANIRTDNYFSLNKNKNNVIVVDNNANIDNLLFTLRTLKLIPENDEKLILELNGNTVIQNGISLSTSQVKLFNKVLLGENVILAPGKVLEIKGEDNYTLGYTLNNGKTHLGTWVMGR
ncbi:hypothetical protein ULMS_22580 [Patiriisocius marinistellae]|uniref:Uncharacterized protein n=1 Tax=Patiriisocius marinistellae TaxID=2494560 RepID=A0A5J4FWZ2_9FLAO|nr:hypothetical protein [Patiriisocius marinistellae]GEQ86750.1 hypothetical protein ULMS_22580 [Patiriisocius marinistellae]